MESILIQLAQAISSDESAALVTVVEAKGASPAKTGAQIVLFQNGTTTGTVGGGKLERVFAPIGLDLGGNSPNEIAVGILAEVIACRQKKGIPERIVKTRRLN